MSTVSAVPGAAAPRLVLADVLPGARVRDAVLVLSGTLLMALMAQVAIVVPPSPVPITGQTLAVGLVGATLGLRRGVLAMALYVLLGLVVPIYSDGGMGLDVLIGSNGGYILGFVVATGAIGWMAERGADRRVLGAFAAFVAAQLIVFVPGIIGLQLATGESWSWTFHNGFAIFIVGGLIKALIGAAVLPSAWRLVRRFER